MKNRDGFKKREGEDEQLTDVGVGCDDDGEHDEEHGREAVLQTIREVVIVARRRESVAR